MGVGFSGGSSTSEDKRTNSSSAASVVGVMAGLKSSSTGRSTSGSGIMAAISAAAAAAATSPSVTNQISQQNSSSTPPATPGGPRSGGRSGTVREVSQTERCGSVRLHNRRHSSSPVSRGEDQKNPHFVFSALNLRAEGILLPTSKLPILPALICLYLILHIMVKHPNRKKKCPISLHALL